MNNFKYRPLFSNEKHRYDVLVTNMTGSATEMLGEMEGIHIDKRDCPKPGIEIFKFKK